MPIFQLNQHDLGTLGKNWGWFFAWGLALVVLGLLAVSYAFSSTIISIIFLGVLLCVGGIVIIFDSFQSWWGRWSGFLLHLGMGILYLIAGVMLIKGPIIGSITLTLLLAIFYIVLGIFRIVNSISLWNLPNHGWRLFGGIVTLLLGILILLEWPMRERK